MLERIPSLSCLVLSLGCAATPTQSADAPPAATAEADTRPIEEAFVSQSGGEPGGLVVFWPRVIPRSEAPEVSQLAGQVQAKLVELAEQTFPERSLDVRPEPERVCPRGGCPAATFGVLLVHKGEKCAAVALTSAGETATNDLAVWAGDVRLKLERVAFREYPENHVAISGYVPCDQLVQAMTDNDEAIVAALRATAG
jgi:hypothetical protein